MIDWTKPIETVEARRAWVLDIYDDIGAALVTYDQGQEYTTVLLYDDAAAMPVRNKPELIMPEGWVMGFVGGATVTFASKPEECDDDWAFSVTWPDMLSGKVKDGIPVGYVSEDE